MFQIELKNNKVYQCSEEHTIFEAAKTAGIQLEHSCLSARCRSCKAKVVKGTTKSVHDSNVLTESEKREGYILTCNSIPLSDIQLNIVDIDNGTVIPSKKVPAKIDGIIPLTVDVIKLILRIPPTANFEFHPGQYINLEYKGIKRSYSIANHKVSEDKIEFFIKNYSGGKLSHYFFNEAKVNDLIRMEGPFGTFFYRKTKKDNILFLATGTGIAPVKSILESFNEDILNFKDKQIWIFWGGREEQEFYWNPMNVNFNIHFIPVLSRPGNSENYEIGYVQNIVINKNIDLKNSTVYACGSNKMIEDSFELLIKYGLDEKDFYSDAFVVSN